MGCVFSVALSLGSPPVVVSHLPALWSPDFPLPKRSSGSDPPSTSGAESTRSAGSGLPAEVGAGGRASRSRRVAGPRSRLRSDAVWFAEPVLCHADLAAQRLRDPTRLPSRDRDARPLRGLFGPASTASRARTITDLPAPLSKGRGPSLGRAGVQLAFCSTAPESSRSGDRVRPERGVGSDPATSAKQSLTERAQAPRIDPRPILGGTGDPRPDGTDAIPRPPRTLSVRQVPRHVVSRSLHSWAEPSPPWRTRTSALPRPRAASVSWRPRRASSASLEPGSSSASALR